MANANTQISKQHLQDGRDDDGQCGYQRDEGDGALTEDLDRVPQRRGVAHPLQPDAHHGIEVGVDHQDRGRHAQGQALLYGKADMPLQNAPATHADRALVARQRRPPSKPWTGSRASAGRSLPVLTGLAKQAQL